MAPSLADAVSARADKLRDAKEARALALQAARREEAARVCDLLVAKVRAGAFDARAGVDDSAVTVTYASRLFPSGSPHEYTELHEYRQAVRSEVEARFALENVRIPGIELTDVSLGKDVERCADDGFCVVASLLCCCLPLVCYIIPCCVYRACTRARPTVRCTVSMRAMAPGQPAAPEGQGVVVVGTPAPARLPSVELSQAVVQCMNA